MANVYGCSKGSYQSKSMSPKKKFMGKLGLCLTAALMMSLTACAGKFKFDDAQYWQRRELRDSFQMDGASKQQWLNSDLAACVADMRELGREGQMRDAIPGPAGKSDADVLADWDTPGRDGYLLMEHKNYPDFEACMRAKGWERVDSVPYPVAEEAVETYQESRGIKTEKQKQREEEAKKNKSGGTSYFNL